MTCLVNSGVQGLDPKASVIQIRRNFRHTKWLELFTDISVEGWSYSNTLQTTHKSDATTKDAHDEPSHKKTKGL